MSFARMSIFKVMPLCVELVFYTERTSKIGLAIAEKG